jgi:arabinogalactan oligomer/maltooligosaccharide transport system permease protein
VRVWHSYRGGEEQALTSVARAFEATSPGTTIDLLANPYENFASKLSTAIPNDNGPDAFIFAHERLGPWARTGILAPLDGRVPDAEWADFLPETLPPLAAEGRRWALPLGFKSLALFYNKDIIPAPPRTTDELLALARAHSGGGRFGLAYQADNFFFHAPWFYGFGGGLFGAEGRAGLDSEASARALAFVTGLADAGVLPAEPTGSLVSRLFNDGASAMTISGPWFVGEIAPGVRFGVAPLPIVSATGKPASPFLTDEAVYVSARARETAGALEFARFLAGREAAIERAVTGRQVVANARAWEDPRLSGDAVLLAFREQLASAVPTPTHPEMRNVWEPATLMLKKALRHEASPEQAAQAGERRFQAISRPAPAEADPRPYVAIAALGVVGALALALRWIRGALRTGDREHATVGFAWTAPALTATLALVFVPFAIGLALAFFDHREGRFTFVGLANFVDIAAARRFGAFEPLSFYYALVVTVLWTAVNLALHVGIGLSLALLLDQPALRLKGVYRVLLVVPWAVPNYITALLWKGLFHKQFGAINGLLSALGLDGVAWFSSFGTAFFANVCTNAWLGFPFMMVVCLGALQSIPRELYEAADVDGASAWDKFRHVTWPLLQPALVPAVLLGVVWTFNAFNVVYLVSGGEPDNATDILISEAYRWAFARQEQYGYAAAYAALIFLLLLGWSHVSQRLSRRAEAMR